ncbi:hypothetical protein E3N88_22851 [Mikania micrantha]|uniref:Uncharacterized protein n=1 Tax=Mikania micrantha TaxID=192012 RepID=A0A5N6NDB9_9ASTR|nr:hypothetical protein E3N88_22851 [Mikania micrantha]
MDPRAPFSFTHLLNDDDVQQNPPQQPSFPQFSQTQQFSQYSQLQPFPQFHQQGPSFPQFGQFPSMPQFSQPQPAFDAQQWQQFLQWQQYQKTSQMHQTQFLPTQEHVESPSKGKATKKMKKPSKMANENDEQPTKTSRQKWPQSDEAAYSAHFAPVALHTWIAISHTDAMEMNFSQPQPAFDAQQWQQFLQWQQYQKTSQMHQTQFLPTQEHVESPSKGKATKKMKKPSKMANENDEQPTKTSRQKWPQSDEVLLAQAMISTSENALKNHA